MRALSRAACVTALAAAITSCGGKSPTAPTPFTQTVAGTVSSLGYTAHEINVSRSGVLTATLTWSSSAVDLDLYLTNGSCADVYLFSCPRLATSDRAAGTAETITRSVSRGEQFKVWVDNFSFGSHSYTVNVRIE
jgi:hypothetical protein